MEKDLLIYDELCKCGQEVFDWLMKQNRKNINIFKNLKKKDANNLAKEITEFEYDGSSEFANTPMVIDVDTFHCEFEPAHVFCLMATFKKSIKGAKDYVFEYEEEVGEHLATIEVQFDSTTMPKKLADCVEKHGYIPVMSCVLLELNQANNDVNIVASDGHIISVLSNSVETIDVIPDNGKTIQSLFDVQTWKQICNAAKYNDNEVRFELYSDENDCNSKAIAVCGNKKFYSVSLGCSCLPWHNVIVKEEETVRLTKDGQKEFNKFAKLVSKELSPFLNMSYYSGNKHLYCEYVDKDFDKKIERTFELENIPQETKGTRLNAKYLLQVGFAGFRRVNAYRENLLISNAFDYTLLMSILDNGKAFVPSEEIVSQREFADEKAARIA